MVEAQTIMDVNDILKVILHEIKDVKDTQKTLDNRLYDEIRDFKNGQNQIERRISEVENRMTEIELNIKFIKGIFNPKMLIFIWLPMMLFVMIIAAFDPKLLVHAIKLWRGAFS